MGSQSVKAIQSKEDRKNFIKHLLNDVSAFEKMLQDGTFEKGIQRVGAEQEICIVNDHYTPAYNALEILKELNEDHFTTELALFNLELNLDPYELKGDCFSKMENQLLSFLDKLHVVAEKQKETKPILTGILPTLLIKDLDFKYVTPFQRYKTLNEVLKTIRGDSFKLHIQGVDELKLRHDSILFEACNTSFQVHLQIEPKDAIAMYNWSQAIAGPVLSLMTNSPMLLGKELWSETRIALFQQSIDLRTKSHLLRGQKPRVSYGSDWIRNSILEIFTDDIARYTPLVTSDFEEDSLKQLNQGIMPELKALNLHNGTLYKWNRLCYGVHKNVAHLRIENRYIPSGPSVKDEIANALFWIGVMKGMPDEYREIWKKMPFKEAKGNFMNAAKTGIDTYFSWFGKEVSAVKLAKKVLLPMAKKGLQSLGVANSDIDKYIKIIKLRVEKRATGSKWLVRNKRLLNSSCSMHETNVLLTKKMYEYQLKNVPIHEWEDFEETIDNMKSAKNKAYKIMTREIFVANEEDSVELIAKIMEWKKIHHVPVMNNEHKIVGMVNQEMIDSIDIEKSNDRELVSDEIMNKNIVVIHPETNIEEMQKLMNKHDVSSLVVIYNDELIGIVTQNDLLEVKNQIKFEL